MIRLLSKQMFRDMSSVINISHRISLNDGKTMPLFGLGSWLTGSDEAAYNAVAYALKEGYRLIDTAALYKNEEAVGKALRDSGLDRDEYFLVTKLDSEKHGFQEAKESCMTSLEKFGLDYVDLFLIHTPRPGRVVDTWKALVELKKEGKTKSIGVSNFSGEQIEGLMKYGMEKPAVNQIEIHPLHQQPSTVSYCRKNNIAIMGFCPLARCKLFEDGRVPVVDKIASNLNKTKAQVFLRWAIQNNFITIPKSTNPGRIKENRSLFDWSISDDDMKTMSTIDEDFPISRVCAVMKERWELFEK